MPALAGKKAVVYLTYAIDVGKALGEMSDAVAVVAGAEVLGGSAHSPRQARMRVSPTSSTAVLDVTASA